MGWKRDGKFDSQKTKQRRELDDRVQGNRRGVLEGVADGVAYDCGGMKLGALSVHFGFDDLLCVIPCAAGIGHEDGLEEAEDGDGDKVADEEERIGTGKGKR